MPAMTKRRRATLPQAQLALLQSGFSPADVAAHLRISRRMVDATRRALREAELRAADAEAARDADALYAERERMDEAFRRRERGWSDTEIADSFGINVEDLPWRSF